MPARVLWCGRCARGEGRGAADQDRVVVSTGRPIRCPRSDDQEGEGALTATVEEGVWQQARVENAFFRYKSIVGDCLRARSSSGQRREAVLACNVLNRMTELGRPVSCRIGR